jgi:hypothetical protein
MNLAEKIISGTFVVVALFLVLTNPGGDAAAGNAVGTLYVGGVKALQGR